MKEHTFTMWDHGGHDIFVYRWLPEDETAVHCIVQIAHGMCETAHRYLELAECLTASGYAVYANDHIGHGKTASATNSLGNPGPDAFNRMARNMIEVGDIASSEFPGVPRILMGHSMGSFLTQKVMYAPDQSYDGFILSGTNGRRRLLRFGERMAMMQAMMQGTEHRSWLLNAIVFGGFNRSFQPVRTSFDWLSRDPEEVDRFIQDPLCGAICTTDFFRSFFRLLQEIHLPDSLGKIDKAKPVYIFAGDKDPVGMFGKGVLSLVQMYKELGMERVEYKLYPDGRHEMLHEINREEVMSDLIGWLQRNFSLVSSS
ncbi:lysophospholipase [Paenibacillus sp. P96]|uniref:Lysophospholipase n=1 Tax=Paenibacillus zeirhizosphaerae TaxID=2987519 RepID=A0ABT9FL17_9BACL|nr:alpha/beta fold hydrolase [Paenibacillus sp. P96]MDP4095413.1 lysophospholipase [Paenibacillus sp. P96]